MTQEKSICEPENFESIFNNNSEAVRNYIYYKSGDVDLANDMVQEAFIRLWKNCSKVSFSQALFFLKRVANNLFLNVLKHNNVVLEYEQQEQKTTDLQTPEYLLEEKQYMEKLERCIANLTDKQREVFLLNRIDKKSYREIAELLNVSVKAVEKRMHNALKILREKIGDI